MPEPTIGTGRKPPARKVPLYRRATIAAAGSVTVIPATDGASIRIRYVQISADAAVYVYLAFSSEQNDTSKRLHPSYLSARSTVNANKIGSEILGPEADDLLMVTDAAANVDVQVDYDLVRSD